jgi:hypothetical protein
MVRTLYDDRVALAEELSSVIVREKSREELEVVVRDVVLEELLGLGWGDLTLFAEDYGLYIP